jgi:hypothetical protein
MEQAGRGPCVARIQHRVEHAANRMQRVPCAEQSVCAEADAVRARPAGEGLPYRQPITSTTRQAARQYGTRPLGFRQSHCSSEACQVCLAGSSLWRKGAAS